MTSFALDSPLEQHYFESLNVFRSKSTEFVNLYEIFKNHIPSLIQRMLPVFLQQSSFNVLSVGSGTGEMDMEILKIVKEELRRHIPNRHLELYNRAIEPNNYACGIYKAAIGDLQSPLDDQQIRFEIRRQTFEEYKECQNELTKFDIVHFIHSIYYVDIEQTLTHCFENELNGKGHLICLVSGKNLIYWVLSKQRQQWHGIDGESENFETAEKIGEIAARKGWKYEMYPQEYPIDVTEVFDAKSVEGNLLLDFLTHTWNFRKNAEKKHVDETLMLIENLTTVKDGKRLGEINECLVIIYK